MNKKQVLDTIQKLRETNEQRKFLQTVDLIINLKGIDIKKPDQKLDLFVTLPYSKGKDNKICALVDHELYDQAKKFFNKAVLREEFIKYENKKVQKKFVREFDFFIAQANIMTNVASSFGRTLGPLGKMPNPKAECIVSPSANLEPISNRLKTLVHIQTKNDSVIRAPVGNEKMTDDQIAENVMGIYNAVVHALPQDQANISNVNIKFSMSYLVRVGETEPRVILHAQKKKKSKYKAKKERKSKVKEKSEK